VLQTFERPLTTSERADLVLWLDRKPPSRQTMRRWLAFWLATIVGSILAMVGIVTLFDRPGWPRKLGEWIFGPLMLLAIAAVMAMFVVYTSYRRRAAAEDVRESDLYPKIRAALAHGGARVSQVTAVGVVVIQEYEDEQSAFIYDLGDGTCLYLRGEWYYLGGAPEEPWPAREFEIVNTAASNLWISVQNKREELKPEFIAEMQDMPYEFMRGNLPATETVISGSPMEVLRHLGYEPLTDKDFD